MSNRPYIVLAMSILVLACRREEGPSLQVQFCLGPDASSDDLKHTLRQLAKEEGMRYVDRSAETEAELRALEQLPPEVQRSFPIINVSIIRDDGMSLGGGNSGLPANQVTLGLNVGSDERTGQAFVKKALNRLQQRWDPIFVPRDRGAFPLPCPPSA